jgi:hypothetical protein
VSCGVGDLLCFLDCGLFDVGSVHFRKCLDKVALQLAGSDGLSVSGAVQTRIGSIRESGRGCWLCWNISVAGVVVECAGRGRWLGDTNDGLLATGLRKSLSSMSRLWTLWLSQTQTQTDKRRGTASDAVHWALQTSKLLCALRQWSKRCLANNNRFLIRGESEFVRSKGLLLVHARLCSLLLFCSRIFNRFCTVPMGMR